MAYSKYSTKPGYNSRQTINIRNWMEPGSIKPKNPHVDDLERGKNRRKAEDVALEREIQGNVKEIWD